MAMRYPGGLIAPTPVNANYPSGVWTPSQSLPYQQQNVWTRDQYWPYTTLLLQGNGTNGAQNNTFLDSSSNNFSITRNGNTTQGSFTPYEANGYWSNYFDGSGDYLSFTKQTTTGSFTCECWFYRGEDVSGYHIIFSGNNLGSVNPDNAQLRVSNAGAVELALAGSGVIPASGTSVIKNQWNHIAWVRSGTSCAIFVNGTRIATGTSSSALNVVSVGTYLSGYEPNGYVSNARINTTAVYDPSLTTCTVPTAPLTAITGTYLLTCQSNRFIDNSASPLTITVNGNQSVQAFQPFPGATTWSASVLGGSGYFDGTSSLDLPSSASSQIGTNSFCMEAWVYINSTSNISFLIGNGSNNGFYWSLRFAGNTIAVGRTGVAQDASVSYTFNEYTWYHVAVTRSGTDLRFFVNGTQVGSTATVSTNWANLGYRIGAEFTTNYFKGYASNLRLVIGSAVYTSNFSVPTTPLTAITNTQLLCNFTNAGIFDSAMMNDLETVGNAQVSTSIVKYGTGSMAFDGSGDYLQTNNTKILTFNGTNTFTVEAWIYQTAYVSTSGYMNNVIGDLTPTSAVALYWSIGMNASNQPGVRWYDGSVKTADASTALTLNQWNHVAWVVTAGVLKIFINGVQATLTGTTTLTTPSTTVGYLIVGADRGYYMTAYIDDLRITKGVARYISNFTPPPARMPQQ